MAIDYDKDTLKNKLVEDKRLRRFSVEELQKKKPVPGRPLPNLSKLETAFDRRRTKYIV